MRALRRVWPILTPRQRVGMTVFTLLNTLPPHWQDPAGNPHGIGHIAGVFWGTLIEEGLYGSLDALAFHYLDDWYVPQHWWTGVR